MQNIGGCRWLRNTREGWRKEGRRRELTRTEGENRLFEVNKSTRTVAESEDRTRLRSETRVAITRK
jgi:hypothetical protein